MVGQQTLDLFIQVRILVSQHFGKLSASFYMNTSKLWYVYMLLCDQKTFYVGITDNPLARLRQHVSKQSFYTKQFSDIKLVYAEKYTSKHTAAVREKQLKGWTKAKKEALISGNLELLKKLSKRKTK